jgi:tungstate transport system substrate-binding protein
LNTNQRIALSIVIALAVVGSSIGIYLLVRGEEPQALMLATTTSTEDSGLLDYILPDFEKKNNAKVEVIAVGSGQAMELGKRGDVDVLLVHSPASEKQFVADGYGESRTLVMYNQFVIVGPEDDPAGTRQAHNATDAFARMKDNGTAGNAVFVSRSDNSGTYSKELTLWNYLGFNKTQVQAFDGSWYKQTGKAMGAVLDMCEQMDAYTLSDDATYYARVADDLIPHLNITFGGDSDLFNQYSVIPVNATMWPHINHTLALDFVSWIKSNQTQDLIASYVRFDHQLFFPNTQGYVPHTTSVASIEALMRSASTNEEELTNKEDITRCWSSYG